MEYLPKYLVLCAVAFALAPSAQAATVCKRVDGEMLSTLIPTANDPLGRFMGPATGRLKATTTSAATSLTPNPDGTLSATSDDLWVTGAQSLLRFTGTTLYTPIAGAPIGTVQVRTTLSVTGGVGFYAGASGTLTIVGIGVNLFGPAAGAGSTYYDLDYAGTICRTV